MQAHLHTDMNTRLFVTTLFEGAKKKGNIPNVRQLGTE